MSGKEEEKVTVMMRLEPGPDLSAVPAMPLDVGGMLWGWKPLPSLL